MESQNHKTDEKSDVQCPPDKVLRELIDGKIVDPDLTEYSLHLEQCTPCQNAVRTLFPSDTLVNSLRGDASPPEKIAENIPDSLIHVLKQIPATDSEFQLTRDGLAKNNQMSLDELGLSFLSAPQESDEIGQLGHYRILQVLGRGGMGSVFLAEDPKLGRCVALKVMLPKIAGIPMARSRFLREAKAAASLKSDHIVTIYQVDEINSVPFLAMELLQGQSLEDSLKAGRHFSIAETICIVRDVARGLIDAHEKGLVHRDIKPGNLWLEQTPDGATRVKILDFGLARAEVDDVHITEFGTIVGTPAFMAPEQARADRPVDTRADLFSLGCVLYVLCTGDIPFKADTTVGTLMALALNTPIAPDQRNEFVPKDLSRLIMQLLEKDPSQRPGSAREVKERLSQMERTFVVDNADAATMRLKLLSASRPMSCVELPVALPVRRFIGRGLKTATGVLIAACLLIAAEVFLWQPSDGRIVRIECNDPSIKLAFEGSELKLTGAYDQPVTLSPGKVDLKITKPQPGGADFEFETDKLVVRKGDQIVLKIEVLGGDIRIVQDGKGVVDSVSLPLSIVALEAIADKDRRAATWVLSVGGNITIAGFIAGDNGVAEGIPSEIHAIAELPATPFAVTAVGFLNTKPFDTAGFVHLRDLSNLQSLIVEGDFERVTDAAFENLRGCTRLAYLQIGGCRISDKALEVFKDLPALEFVGINGKSGLTDAALVALKSFPALKKLYLNGSNLTDDGLRHLSDFRNLESLGVAGIGGLTDQGLVHVADIKTLTTLDLAATSAGDVTMKRLCELPKLAELSISYTQVTDQGIESLQCATNLKSLSVRDTGVTGGAIERFHAAVPVCRIEFGVEVRIIGETTRPLDSVPPPATSEQLTAVVDALKRANQSFDGALTPAFQEGQIVGLSFKTDYVSDIGALRKLKHLRSLHMIGNYSNDAGVVDLSPLTGLPLTELYLDGNARLSDLAPLKGTSLRLLFAQGTRISDLSPLNGMPLEGLGLWAWIGSDLSPLRGMPLTHLNIGGNGKSMDLTPLLGSPLEFLCINASRVDDISPLTKIPLKTFLCENTLVSDLSPLRDAKLKDFIGGGSQIKDFSVLRGMPLKWIKYDIVPERDLEMLREFKTLERINDQRAVDFLRELTVDLQPGPVAPAFTNSIGMEFARVPKGKAWLIRREAEERVMEKHETVFDDDFYLGTYEVTQEEWVKVMGTNPSWFTRNADGAKSVRILPDNILKRLPVEQVSWLDCQEFLKQLNELDKESGWTYRLPTEAEWQYACRGGPMMDRSESEFEFYGSVSMNLLTFDQANITHERGWNRPCRVGLFEPNKLGLYDMHGNVWEWCDDKAKWLNLESRLLHAGSWRDTASGCSASRIEAATNPWRDYDLGLRVARVQIPQ